MFQQPNFHSPAITGERLYPRVFGWMFVGLSITAIISLILHQDQNVIYTFYYNDWLIWVLFIGTIIISISLQAFITRMSSFMATFLYFLYAALIGLFFTVILAQVGIGKVAAAFFIAAGMFGVSAVVGAITKKDLSSLGSIVIMGIWGIILASIVNFFFIKSSGIELAFSYILVILYCVVTAVKMNEIKQIAAASMDSETLTKVTLIGGFVLFVSFIGILIELINILDRD